MTSENNPELVRSYPELAYSLVRPWISGKTWFEMMRGELDPEKSLILAKAFADCLASFEAWGLAHCDISNGNVVFCTEPSSVELIDVEDLYGKDMKPPASPPGGSPGYAHHTAPVGLWGPKADRFAAAILLVEILGWCDPQTRKVRYGETFFNPKEMPQKNQRHPTSTNFNIMSRVLYERWGKEVLEAFNRAWYSGSLEACPSLTEWSQIVGKLNAPLVQPQKLDSSPDQHQPLVSPPIIQPQKLDSSPDQHQPSVSLPKSPKRLDPNRIDFRIAGFVFLEIFIAMLILLANQSRN